MRCAVLYEKPRSTVQVRVRLAPHRPLDRLPVERRGARLAGTVPNRARSRPRGRYSSRPPPARPRHFTRRGAHDQEEARARRGPARDRGGVRRSRRWARRRLGERRARRSRPRGSTSARTTTRGWSQAHDEGRLYVQKALGSKVQTTYKENVPEGPQVAQVIDSLIRDGNKIIFATSFGFQAAMAAAAKKYPDVKFEMATGTYTSEEHGRVLRRGRGRDLPLRHGRRRGDEERHDRLRRPVRDPRGDPARERVRARRAGDASRREGEADLDELVVRPGQGEEGGGEPPRRRRRRDRAERRQPGRRPVRRVGEASRGSATTRTRRSSRRSSG